MLHIMWNGAITTEELETEEKVIGFDESVRNPVMNMLKYLSTNYGGEMKEFLSIKLEMR